MSYADSEAWSAARRSTVWLWLTTIRGRLARPALITVVTLRAMTCLAAAGTLQGLLATQGGVARPILASNAGHVHNKRVTFGGGR